MFLHKNWFRKTILVSWTGAVIIWVAIMFKCTPARAPATEYGSSLERRLQENIESMRIDSIRKCNK